MKIHLTAAALNDIKLPEGKKQFKVFDTEQNSFGVVIGTDGPKSFFVIYRDEDGKQRQQTIALFEELPVHEARKKAAKLIQDLAADKAGTSAGKDKAGKVCPTVDEYFYSVYLPQVRQRSRSHETHASIYRNHVSATLGQKRLDEVTQQDIRDLQLELSNKGVGCGRLKNPQNKKLAKGTVNRILILVRHLFNVARVDPTVVVRDNPTEFLVIKADKKIKGKFLSKEQMQNLIEASRTSQNKNLTGILILMACTGCRRGNVLRMRWDWIDFNLNTISIPPEADKAKVGYTVSITEAALQELEGRRSASNTQWVFANPKTGKPYSSCRDAWVSCIKKANLEGLRMHDMRHTFASAMLETGADLVQVKNAMGHTQLKTTEVYLHVTASKLRASVVVVPI